MRELTRGDSSLVRTLDTGFVARESELARAIQMLSSVGTHGAVGRTLLLVGEPGIGKSRLAHEILARATEHGFHSLVGRCYEEYTGIPYFPFAEAFGAAVTSMPARARTKFREQWPELTAIVPDLQSALVHVDRQGAQVRVFQAGESFLRVLADRQPVVLLLEDLHWADSATLGLLLHVGRHLQGLRLLILGTYRDIEANDHLPLEASLRELRRERGTEELTLHGLPPAGTAALIRSRLAVEDVPGDFLQLIQGRTDGNPFFIEELLKVLVERGVLAESDGFAGWHLNTPVEVPRSVRSVVRHRVERLQPETQSILRLASVVGQEFDLHVLAAVADQPQAVVLASLGAALAARLLSHGQGSGQTRYAFEHALMQQALYEDLPLDHLQELHGRVARVLEDVSGDNPRFASELARHFLAAGDDAAAIRYSVLAGDFAAASYAHSEAAQHYQNAVELLSKQREQGRLAAEVRCKLGSELNDLNYTQDSLGAYAAALSAFEGIGDGLGQARVQRAIGWVHQSHYAFADAVPHLEAAMHLWPAEHEDAEFGQLLLEAARANVYLTQFTAAGVFAERALALADRLNDGRLRGRAVTEIAALQTHQGVPARLVLSLMERAQANARHAEDWRTITRLHAARAMLTFFAGDLDRARAEYTLGLQIAQGVGLAERVSFNASMVALTCMESGAWSDGRSAGLVARSADPRPLWDFVLPWMEGDFDRALSLAREGLASATRRGDAQAQIRCLTQLADWSLQLERIADAVAYAREAVEFVRTRSYLAWTAAAYGPLAEALTLTVAPEAVAVLTEAEAFIAEQEQHYGGPWLLRARGVLQRQRGDLESALSALKSSADLARAQHAAPQVGRTLAVLADVARSAGQRELAVQADAERFEIVERIGPEVRHLAWATKQPLLDSSPIESAASARNRASPLTRREEEVTALVAQGLTNREIAKALIIAESTAGVHIDHILTKLGFHSRTQLALWAVDRGRHGTPSN
jgi:DNA-binding CsgD family transcriptional regulator